MDGIMMHTLTLYAPEHATQINGLVLSPEKYRKNYHYYNIELKFLGELIKFFI